MRATQPPHTYRWSVTLDKVRAYVRRKDAVAAFAGFHGRKPKPGEVRRFRVTLRGDGIGDVIARAIAPEAWAEFEKGKGVCTNSAGWDMQLSIAAAGRVIEALRAAGLDMPPRPADDPR